MLLLELLGSFVKLILELAFDIFETLTLAEAERKIFRSFGKKRNNK